MDGVFVPPDVGPVGGQPGPSMPVEEDTESYDSAFPVLIGGPNSGGGESSSWANGSKSNFRKLMGTSISFNISSAERKQKGLSGDLNKVCTMIAENHGVKFECNVNRGDSMTITLTGLKENCIDAKNEIQKDLQNTASIRLDNVPKQYHKYIRGQGGKDLQRLERETGTRIVLPPRDKQIDSITIHGSVQGLEDAVHRISIIIQLRERLDRREIELPPNRRFNAFITGNAGATALNPPLSEMPGLQPIVERAGGADSVTVQFRPSQVVIHGDRDAVATVSSYIEKTIGVCRQQYKSVNANVERNQLRYVVGQRGAGLQEVFERTGCYVEVPPPPPTAQGNAGQNNNPQEQLEIFGPPEKLGDALNLVMVRATSHREHVIKCPAWACFHLITGRENPLMTQLRADYPGVHIHWNRQPEQPENNKKPAAGKNGGDVNQQLQDDDITIDGPTAEVRQVVAKLEAARADLLKNKTYGTVSLDRKHFKRVIGTRGKAIQELRKETGARIRMKEQQDMIELEGSPQQVKAAKAKLEAMATRMVNERELEVRIEPRFHGLIIGPNGEKVREFESKFNNDVNVFFPDRSQQNKSADENSSSPGADVVIVRGDAKKVDQCRKALVQLYSELKEKHHQEVRQVKRIHLKDLIGRQGNNLKKLQEGLQGIKIELPEKRNEATASDTAANATAPVTITGPRKAVQEAMTRLITFEKQLANVREVYIDIPYQLHAQIIGIQGQSVKKIQDQCPGVQITIPSTKEKQDKIRIKGSDDQHILLAKLLCYKEAQLLPADYSHSTFHFSNFNVISLPQALRNYLQSEVDAEVGKLEEEVAQVGGKHPPVLKVVWPQPTNVARQQNPKVYDCVVVALQHHSHSQGGGKQSAIGESVDAAARKLNGRVEALLKTDGVEEIVVKPASVARTLVRGDGRQALSRIRRECGVDVSIKGDDAGQRSAAQKKKTEGADDVNDDYLDGDDDNETENEAAADAIDSAPSATLLIKGPRECIDKAMPQLKATINRLESLVSKRLDCPCERRRNAKSLLSMNRPEVAEIRSKYDVIIVAKPEAPATATESAANNGQDDADAAYQQQAAGGGVVKDYLLITGMPDQVDGAIEALRELLPIHHKVEIDSYFHGRLVGPKGHDVSELQRRFGVQIRFPKQQQRNADRDEDGGVNGNKKEEEESAAAAAAAANTVEIYGRKTKVLEAEAEMLRLVEEYSKDFELRVSVDRLLCRRVVLLGKPKVLKEFGGKVKLDVDSRNGFMTFRGEKNKCHEALAFVQNSSCLGDVSALQMVELSDVSARVQRKLTPRPGAPSGSPASQDRRRRLEETYESVSISLLALDFGRNAAEDKIKLIGADADALRDCRDALLAEIEDINEEFHDRVAFQPGGAAAQQSPQQSAGGHRNQTHDDNNNYPRQQHKSRNNNNSQKSGGYYVKDAPWQGKAPDVASHDSFPGFGGFGGPAAGAQHQGAMTDGVGAAPPPQMGAGGAWAIRR